MTSQRRSAILLLGPTGAGKTPLGEMLEARGMRGRPCAHFDFGANLRERVALNEPDAWLSRQEIEFLRAVLESGALLENEQFSIAERILRSFLAHRGLEKEKPNTWIILNGLPRHVDQARLVEPILDVRAVVRLDCSDETVFQRIRSNQGGDRTDRQDDDFQAVRRKLTIYNRRTAPLVDYYQTHGVPAVVIEVTAEMTTEDMFTAVSASPLGDPAAAER